MDAPATADEPYVFIDDCTKMLLNENTMPCNPAGTPT